MHGLSMFYRRRKKPPLEECLRDSKCALNQLFDVGTTAPFIPSRKLAVRMRVGSSVFVPYAFKLMTSTFKQIKLHQQQADFIRICSSAYVYTNDRP